MAVKYLEMKNISKFFPGVKALSDVSIEADEGEIIALLGENGAGKSTLMNILGGVLKKDEGSIFINGKEVEIGTVANATKEGISFIHQELSLFKELSIEDNMFIEKFPKKPGTPFIDKSSMRMLSLLADVY
jgi:ribose transport system ATP-binding protein